MDSLAESERAALLQIARDWLVGAVNQTQPPPHDLIKNVSRESALARPGGAFVTLLRAGRLRGCIGRLPGEANLVEVVAYCAKAVASEDPRFTPVLADELAGINIEISVLSEPGDIRPEDIEIGKHGLLATNAGRRGVLLPQVATQFHWNGIRFLEATCEKAGLAKDAWKARETRLQAFTADVFSEDQFRNERSGPPRGYSSST